MRFLSRFFGIVSSPNQRQAARVNSSHGLRLESLETRALLTTLFVDGDTGDDGNSGAANAPFETISAAIAELSEEGEADKIVILSGTYVEAVEIEHSDPLTIAGTGGDVVIAGESEDDDVFKILNSHVTFRNLTITGGDDGIDTEVDPGDEVDPDDVDGSLTLINVNVVGNDDRGVEADALSSVTVIGGSYSENGGDGIKVEIADQVTIVGASVSGNDSDGLDLEVIGSISLRNLTTNGNDDEGIEVDDSDTVSIVNVESSGNADDGIDIDNSRWISIVNVVSTGNGDFEDPDGNGLQIEADEMTVEYVSVVNALLDGNADNGVQIVGDVDQVILKSVVATSNQNSGLDIDITGQLTLLGVTSEGNGEADNLP